MDKIWIWIFLAFVTEVLIIEAFYKWVPWLSRQHDKYKDIISIKMSISLLFGLLFSFGATLDFFVMFAIPFMIPVVGIILSGFFIMAGHGVIELVVETWKSKVKKEVEKEAGL